MSAPMDQLAAIILAAGKGTRMKSELPKVLHPVCGTPMLGRVIRAIRDLGIQKVCAVVGGDVAGLASYLNEFNPITLAVQTDRLGTGEAVACAGHAFSDTKIPGYARGHFHSGAILSCRYVLICAGDTPALDSKILRDFIEDCQNKGSRLAVLAMDHPKPTGYGRIIQDKEGLLEAIVEEKDASPEQQRITLCNSGVIYAELSHLFSLLAQLSQNNAQKEYYLTDTFHLSRQAGTPASVYTTPDYGSFDGVNNRVQLSQLEERLQRQLKETWMLKGVSFRLPDTSFVDDSVEIGEDCVIGPNSTLLGRTKIGSSCEIGSHTVLKNVMIPDATVIPAGTIRIQS